MTLREIYVQGGIEKVCEALEERIAAVEAALTQPKDTAPEAPFTKPEEE